MGIKYSVVLIDTKNRYISLQDKTNVKNFSDDLTDWYRDGQNRLQCKLTCFYKVNSFSPRVQQYWFEQRNKFLEELQSLGGFLLEDEIEIEME